MTNSVQPPDEINLDSSDMLHEDMDLNLEDLMKQKVRQWLSYYAPIMHPRLPGLHIMINI